MSMLLIAAAAGIYTAPLPVYADSWISPFLDWPKNAVREDRPSYVAMEITVNTMGGVTDCRGRSISGHPGMAAYTCKLVKLRGEFKPARDPSGKKMYGVHRQNFVWWMSSKPPAPGQLPRHVDYELAVDRLPPGVELPAGVVIQFFVEANGAGSACTAVQDKDNSADLGRIACERLAPSLRVRPATDRKGRPVPSVQNAKVGFVVAKAPN